MLCTPFDGINYHNFQERISSSGCCICRCSCSCRCIVDVVVVVVVAVFAFVVVFVAVVVAIACVDVRLATITSLLPSFCPCSCLLSWYFVDYFDGTFFVLPKSSRILLYTYNAARTAGAGAAFVVLLSSYLKLTEEAE